MCEDQISGIERSSKYLAVIDDFMTEHENELDSISVSEDKEYMLGGCLICMAGIIISFNYGIRQENDQTLYDKVTFYFDYTTSDASIHAVSVRFNNDEPISLYTNHLDWLRDKIIFVEDTIEECVPAYCHDCIG